MPVIEVSNLHKRYGDQVAVDDISFTVERGEIFGILGPNGAGKTTTVECVEGIRRPDGGSVRVLGMDPQHDEAELRERVGAQLQESQLPDKMRVGEALSLYASLYRAPASQATLLADLGLTEKVNTYYGKLSGGQKQRLSIALALIGNPEIAILDELTTGLDPNARRDTWHLIETIRGRGATIVLVTHYMDEAERLCDRLAIIDKGRIVALDTPSALIASIATEQRMHFRLSVPFDEWLLTQLPEVKSVTCAGSEVVVVGTGNLVYAVTAALAAKDIVAANVRVEQANLEDAFVALTGRSIDD